MIEHKAYNIIQLIYRAKTYEGRRRITSFRAGAWRSIGMRVTTMLCAPCATSKC